MKLAFAALSDFSRRESGPGCEHALLRLHLGGFILGQLSGQCVANGGRMLYELHGSGDNLTFATSEKNWMRSVG